jgi:ABC-2 type transport system ATP-binding protein
LGDSLPDAVVITGLRKAYGKVNAVANLNLAVHEGEIYGLIGPNGSGKTTTVKILCGLLKPDGGEAYVLGSPAGGNSVRPLIGYMPQDLAIYPDLRVIQNLDFFGRLYGLGGDKLKAREKALLRMVALEGRETSLVSTLSGGMKHRLSLACSMIHGPRLLFLDEPTVGVDPELRSSFWQYLGKLKEGGVTALITTHYMDEAGRCDRVGLIREGRLIAEGTPKELRESAGCESLEDAFLVFSRGDAK